MRLSHKSRQPLFYAGINLNQKKMFFLGDSDLEHRLPRLRSEAWKYRSEVVRDTTLRPPSGVEERIRLLIYETISYNLKT